MPRSILYLKEQPKIKRPKTKARKKTERFFFMFIAIIGLSSVIFTVWPYFSWQFKTLPRLTAKADIAPIPKGQVLSTGTVNAANVQVVKDPDGFSYFVPTDFKEGENPRSYFTTDYQPQGKRPEEFFVSIPKLEIEKARAKVDSLRFDKHLSHFPGSAIPGEVGNAFVTGHSVLPQFGDPDNYRKIFSKLDKLEIGDEVIVETQGQKMKFVVQYSKVVNPKDLSVLAPVNPSSRNLTLMTCVPPGTNLKRLVVITSLI